MPAPPTPLIDVADLVAEAARERPDHLALVEAEGAA